MVEHYECSVFLLMGIDYFFFIYFVKYTFIAEIL